MSIYSDQELASAKFLESNPDVIARISVEIVRKVILRRVYDIRSGEARNCIRAPLVRFDRNGWIAYQI